MSFFNIIRKGADKQLDTLKASAIYEIAAEKLEPKSYAELAKPLYLLSNYFSNAYHFISFVVAITGITIFALQLDSLLQKTILIVLSFLLLLIIEIAKSNASNTVFSSVGRKENPNKLFLIVLVLTTLFSFCTSVWSAKESIYFASTNTKFSNIDSLQNSQIDSVNQLYSSQIIGLQNVMKANQNVISTSKTNWKINIATDGLNKAQTNLNSVLESKQKALLSITDQTKNSKGKTDEKGKEIAIFAAVLFALFELLNLVCYWFVYQYYQSCLLENNLPNNSEGTPKGTQEKEATDTVLNAVKAFFDGLQISNATANVTTSVTPNVEPSFLGTPKPQKSIGFQFGNNSQTTANVPNEKPNEAKTELTKGNRICEFDECKEAYTYKVHNQKFCSEKCRIANWNKKNGKTFIKGKR